MKISSYIYIVCLLFVAGCSAQAQPSAHPAQNKQLNAISPSGKPTTQKKGYLQQAYDTWEKEDWEPNTQQPAESPSAAVKAGGGTETVTQKTGDRNDTNASETYTLQYYFDKWGRYLDEKDKHSTGPSHKETMDGMPAIGGQ